MSDVIQKLRELRQSSKSSVVTGIEEAPSDDRPLVEHPVEAWLVDLILEQLTAPEGPSLSLIVLSGNAGDGKSHLLREIRQRLVEEQGLDPAMIDWLLDATESSHQTQRAVDRLDGFFAPFADDADWSPERLHILAMNTGTVVRFFAHDQERRRFRTLCDILGLQLAIRSAPEDEDLDDYWTRFDRVLVIDLDRRMLIPLDEAEEGFLDRMLDTLDRSNEGGLLADASTDCSSCHFAERCPVNTNLVALQNRTVRQRLGTILRDVSLEDRIHLGPRGLWHLIYQLTVGGLDAQSVARREALPTCADVAGLDDTSRSRSLFFSALFEAHTEGADAGGAALLAELSRVDPARRFTLDAHEHALAAGLSDREDLRLAGTLASTLGLPPEALAGPSDDPGYRASAAVRRAFFIGDSDPDSLRHRWLRTWAANLRTHRSEIVEGRATRHESVALLVSVLIDLYGARDQRGLWHLTLPWRNRADLYAQLVLRPGQRARALDPRVLGPDSYREGGIRPLALEMAEHLGAQPLSITVPLRNGPDVRVTWPLLRLLQRVGEEKYIAASLNPERVQNLERIGASLGAQAALSGGVAVLTADGGLVCEDDGAGGYDVVDL